MKRNKLDIDYSQWVRELEVTKNDSVWEEIQDELDFIESWDKISAKLDEIKPLPNKPVSMKYRKTLIAAAAMILIILIPFRLLNEQANQLNISSELNNETVNKKVLTDSKPKFVTNEKEKPETIQPAATEIPPAKDPHRIQQSKLSNKQSITTIESKDAEDTVFSMEEFSMHEMQNLPLSTNIFSARTNDIPINTIEPQLNNNSKPVESSNFSFKIAEVGLVYAYKNTWLLNYETRNGLNPEKLSQTLPTFHQDIGLSTTLAFNNQHLFGLEFFLKSKTGQNYQQYINASFVERNINLDYLKLQGFYIRNFQKVPGEVIFGGYFASLTMAEEQREKIKINMNNNYNNHNFGLLAGYQFNIAFENNITVKPSLRLNYNLNNIFKGDDLTPGYLKNTKSFAASFNLSLSYRF